METCSCDFADTTLWNSVCSVPFMLTMETLFQVTNSISDSCNRLVPVEEPYDDYDFIVVGAGVAGAVVTRRLIEASDWRVLLIEAGPLEPTVTQIPFFVSYLVNTSLDWGYTTEPEEGVCLHMTNNQCPWPRGKTVGGSSVFTDLMYTRGHPEDFDKWPKDNDITWDYSNVLPYFRKSENNQNVSFDSKYHGFEGPLPLQRFPSEEEPPLAESIIHAAEQMGYEYNEDVSDGANVRGFTRAQFIIKNGTRYSTARAYLRPYRTSPNFDIVVNTRVSNIIIDPTTKIATGVNISYTMNGKEITKIVNANKEVILSAGSINSPQLLMLSGIGPKDHLAEHGIEVIQDLPVGKSLQNHVGTNVRFTINETFVTELNDDSVKKYVDNQTGPLSTNGITQITGFISSLHAETGHADLQIFLDGYSSGCPTRCQNGEGPECTRRPITIRPTLLAPRSTGNITLRSNNPFDPPRIYYNYFSNETDLEILKEGVHFILNLTQTDALKPWDFQIDTSYLPDCEDYVECTIMWDTVPENHQTSTAKMGLASDPTAVVGVDLKVHGVNNLRVIDASVLPFTPHANPISTIVMVAERGADIIKETYNKLTSAHK